MLEKNGVLRDATEEDLSLVKKGGMVPDHLKDDIDLGLEKLSNTVSSNSHVKIDGITNLKKENK